MIDDWRPSLANPNSCELYLAVKRTRSKKLLPLTDSFYNRGDDRDCEFSRNNVQHSTLKRRSYTHVQAGIKVMLWWCSFLVAHFGYGGVCLLVKHGRCNSFS